MPLIGAHMSIAGGLYKAADAAAELGMDTVQIFTNSPSQWTVPPVSGSGATPGARVRSGKIAERWSAQAFSTDQVRGFVAALAAGKLQHPIAHSSYLINLASPDPSVWKRSIDAMVVELLRASQLEIPYVVVHPGASLAAGETRGIRNVIRALKEVQRQTKGLLASCLLENTAGQGTCLGWQFEQLGRMLDGVHDSERIGVCIDTCHAFAAGYPLADPADYDATTRLLDQAVGIQRIKALHLNDSKRELGSRVDRHEHIGLGKLGLEPFRHLLNDPRFASIPMYMETPKETYQGRSRDSLNLATLRGLVAKSTRGSQRKNTVKRNIAE